MFNYFDMFDDIHSVFDLINLLRMKIFITSFRLHLFWMDTFKGIFRRKYDIAAKLMRGYVQPWKKTFEGFYAKLNPNNPRSWEKIWGNLHLKDFFWSDIFFSDQNHQSLTFNFKFWKVLDWMKLYILIYIDGVFY